MLERSTSFLSYVCPLSISLSSPPGPCLSVDASHKTHNSTGGSLQNPKSLNNSNEQDEENI